MNKSIYIAHVQWTSVMQMLCWYRVSNRCLKAVSLG